MKQSTLVETSTETNVSVLVAYILIFSRTKFCMQAPDSYIFAHESLGLIVINCFCCVPVKYLDFLRKRCNVKPARGPFHFRAPSQIFWRVVRGMVPHKTKRGSEAMNRLKVFEGIPPPYDKVSHI